MANLLRFAPGVTLSAVLPPEQLTRDPVMQAERLADPLIHDRISPPLFFGMIESGRRFTESAGKVTQPLLLVVGGSDPVINPEHTRLVFERFGSPDKTLLLYPAMRHEPLNELGREKVISDIADWTNLRLRART